MYYSITGKVTFYAENRLVVECGGIGYDLAVSNNALVKLGKQGETVTVFTWLQVQDDAIRLYGFCSKEEKALFEKLISVSGVGAKMALQILSGMELRMLSAAIAGGDAALLSKIKGVGKKTAERICLELKEKMEDADPLAAESLSVGTGDEVTRDAIAALVSLGINKTEAARAVGTARQKSDILESVVTLALRSLG